MTTQQDDPLDLDEPGAPCATSFGRFRRMGLHHAAQHFQDVWVDFVTPNSD